MTNLIAHITTSPISLTALAKVTGLTQTKLTMALVGLAGQITVLEGGIILMPIAQKPAPVARGPIARLIPRHDTVRAALHAAVLLGPVSAKDLEALIVPLGARYADIGYIADQEVAAGNIIVSHKGRVRTWSLPATEVVSEPAPETVTVTETAE